MSAPKRIRRQRGKGWRMPEGAIYVGRPTKWGNPFRVGDLVVIHPSDPDEAGYTVDLEGPLGATLAQAVAGFRDLMEMRLTFFPNDHPEDRAYSQQWRDDLEALRGHDLVCWCPLDGPCHADVLLDLANT